MGHVFISRIHVILLDIFCILKAVSEQNKLSVVINIKYNVETEVKLAGKYASVIHVNSKGYSD